jgi:Domain of unknown function (DU1801)
VADQKTTPTTASVDTYVASVGTNERQADCRALVALFRKVTHEPPVMWGSSIIGFGRYHYKYASGHEGDACLVGFSSRKTDLTLYLLPGFEERGPLLAKLGPHKAGKGCLYVKRLAELDLTVLETLIRASYTDMQRRVATPPASATQGARRVTPLFTKLNLTSHDTIHVVNAPRSFEPELNALGGVTIRRFLRGPTTFALAFVVTKADLEGASTRVANGAQGDAVVWMAYPKGTSKKYTCEFNRDTGWSALGKAGFEPVRQVAIDDDWSALRFRHVEHIKTLTRAAKHAISDAGKARARKTSRVRTSK